MPRRLFMIWTSPIFRDSVHLLLNHPEVEWLGTASDYTAAQEDIRKLRPDTIVVEEAKGALPAQIIELLEAENTILKLILISLEDNRLRVFSRETWTVAEADDLLRLILQ